MYNAMTTGEKRSLTSSLKKNAASFIDNIQGDFLSYPSKEAFLDAFYTYWITQATRAQLVWCKNEQLITDPAFKAEMMERIGALFAEELQVFDKRETMHADAPMSFPRLRSKKKRLRKKREKMLLQLT